MGLIAPSVVVRVVASRATNEGFKGRQGDGKAKKDE
jgi:hypothetical protein